MEPSRPCVMPPEDVSPLYDFMSNCSASFKQLCAVSTAVELKMFDLLDTWQTSKSISQAIGADPAMVEDMCEILSDLNFLERGPQGYRNTSLSRTFLKRESQWFQGEVIKNLQFGFRLWEQLTHICQHGPISLSDSELFAKNNFIESLQAEILTGELQKTVSVVSDLPEFDSATSLLDLGGGHGLYAIAFCLKYPDLHGVIFDLPALEQAAMSTIQQFGAPHVRFVPGNMFEDDYGKDYDVVFFSYSPGGRNPYILTKIHDSLKAGGLFISKHAFYRNEEGSKSRLLDLEWQLTAINGIKKGRRIYSFGRDLSFEDYMAVLKEKFTVLKIVESSVFAKPGLHKFGDTLDSIIVVSKKNGSPDKP